MRATFPSVQVAILMVCLPISAQQPGESPLDWFHRMDRNKDGKLSRQEVSSPQFNEFDSDGGGFVIQDEFKAYYTKPRADVGPAKPAAQSAPPTPGALFRRVEIPGFSDIVEGTNGLALADLNHDGLADIVATYTEPNRGLSNTGHHLRVFINEGNFRFQMHPITIRESKLTGENFGTFPQIPNLVDFNGDGLLDMFITRHSPFWAGKQWPGVEPIGNTLLSSDGAWDTFRDVSVKLGVRNETAYNRQSSIADVNKDGWLDIAIGCDNIGNAIGGVSHSRLYLSKDEGGGMKEEGGGMNEEGEHAVSRSPDHDTPATEGLPTTKTGDLAVGVSAGSGDPRRAQDPRRALDIPHPSSLILHPSSFRLSWTSAAPIAYRTSAASTTTRPRTRPDPGSCCATSTTTAISTWCNRFTATCGRRFCLTRRANTGRACSVGRTCSPRPAPKMGLAPIRTIGACPNFRRAFASRRSPATASPAKRA